MATFDSDGVTIHHEGYSAGEPLVLMHGFASNLKDNWELTDWVNGLAYGSRRVAGPDCRGHGVRFGGPRLSGSPNWRCFRRPPARRPHRACTREGWQRTCRAR